MSEASTTGHTPPMSPDDFPEKESEEYRCSACGACELPAEVWKDLVAGHWFVKCAACGVVDLVESADTERDISRRGHE